MRVSVLALACAWHFASAPLMPPSRPLDAVLATKTTRSQLAAPWQPSDVSTPASASTRASPSAPLAPSKTPPSGPASTEPSTVGAGVRASAPHVAQTSRSPTPETKLQAAAALASATKAALVDALAADRVCARMTIL